MSNETSARDEQDLPKDRHDYIRGLENSTGACNFISHAGFRCCRMQNHPIHRILTKSETSARIEGERKMRDWTPVSYEMPPIGAIVLCWLPLEEVTYFPLFLTLEGWNDGTGEPAQEHYVTHWKYVLSPREENMFVNGNWEPNSICSGLDPYEETPWEEFDKCQKCHAPEGYPCTSVRYPKFILTFQHPGRPTKSS